MAIYTKLRATAQRLIQKNGRTVTYRRKSTTLIDVNQPQLGSQETFTDTTPKAAFVNTSFVTQPTEVIQAGDLIALIAADDLSGFTPDVSHIIVDKGKDLSIISFDSIDPSDAPIAYQFILRA